MSNNLMNSIKANALWSGSLASLCNENRLKFSNVAKVKKANHSDFQNMKKKSSFYGFRKKVQVCIVKDTLYVLEG